MAHYESPPFGRGDTFYNGGTIDSTNYGGLQLEGAQWFFQDLQWITSGIIGAKPARTNRLVKCMVVRNVSAAAILPSQLVTLQKVGTDGRYYCGRVDGLVTTTADRCYPADEFLPSAGVPVGDLFWIVIET